MKIIIGSDHGGYRLKSFLVHALILKGYDVEDLGTDSSDHPVDYPDFAAAVARAVVADPAALGIALCGTGIGASIAANKVHGIRCALVHDCYTARMAKEHNNANVLALGGRTTAEEIALECVMTWLNATYQGGRHQPRIDKITALESEPHKN
ncbi:MAG TPA: ribose 5-phosphate isomerase B [Candidatus Cryosericum sp.]|mgnify:FL=1|nr:ribose 5-phosphate isomerase B [Candidatus Cryosericum sp.]HPS70148.1 ribose 5-phosphate isomerase B [Candidatus Cryosericum sp.]